MMNWVRTVGPVITTCQASYGQLAQNDIEDLLRPDGDPQPVQLLGGQLHRALLGVERVEMQLVVASERLGVHTFVSELWTALNTNSSKIELETTVKLS